MTRRPRAAGNSRRLVAVTLDEASIGRSGPDVEHERAVAIYDLLEENNFDPAHDARGPFKLKLSITGNRLVFDIRRQNDEPVMAHLLSLTPLRRIVKDYYLICESYYDAIKRLSPSQIEALDMGRRGLHNEGSELLMERLKDKIGIDFDTAPRPRSSSTLSSEARRSA